MDDYTSNVIPGYRQVKEDYLNPGYYSDYRRITCYLNGRAHGVHYDEIEHLLYGTDSDDGMDENAGADIVSGFAELFGVKLKGGVL